MSPLLNRENSRFSTHKDTALSEPLGSAPPCGLLSPWSAGGGSLSYSPNLLGTSLCRPGPKRVRCINYAENDCSRGGHYFNPLAPELFF